MALNESVRPAIEPASPSEEAPAYRPRADANCGWPRDHLEPIDRVIRCHPRVFVNPSVAVPVRVVKLAHTSVWHPSQWEGWTETGEITLVRFRYGHLWIGLTPDFISVPTTLLAAHHGHDCGYLAFKQVREHSVGFVE